MQGFTLSWEDTILEKPPCGVGGSFRPATLLKFGSDTDAFLQMLRFFKNCFFYGAHSVAIMSTRKEIRVPLGTKVRGKIFQMKKENKKF